MQQVLHLHPLLHHLGWLELLEVFPQARGGASGELYGRPTQLGEQLVHNVDKGYSTIYMYEVRFYTTHRL